MVQLTFPTAASPSSTSLTLLLSLGAVVGCCESAIRLDDWVRAKIAGVGARGRALWIGRTAALSRTAFCSGSKRGVRERFEPVRAGPYRRRDGDLYRTVPVP